LGAGAEVLKPKVGVKKGGDFEAVKKRVDEVQRLLEKGAKVAVGLPRNSMPYPDGTSVIMVGFWNEFGTKFTHERAFLRTAARENRDAWLALSRDIYKRAVAKNKDPNDFLSILGQRMEADVKRSIDSGAWEPNQGAYGEWKLSKGKTKPLIVSGHLRGSIRYVIRKP